MIRDVALDAPQTDEIGRGRTACEGPRGQAGGLVIGRPTGFLPGSDHDHSSMNGREDPILVELGFGALIIVLWPELHFDQNMSVHPVLLNPEIRESCRLHRFTSHSRRG